MESEKKAPRKVYLVQQKTVPADEIDEFNRFWKENTLHMWDELGAKLVVAGTNIVAGPSHEITMVYELESLEHWVKVQEFFWDWWEREEGPGRTMPPQRYRKYLTTLEQKLLRAIY